MQNSNLTRSQMKNILGGVLDPTKLRVCGTREPAPYTCLCDYCLEDGTVVWCEISCPLDNCGILPPGTVLG